MDYLCVPGVVLVAPLVESTTVYSGEEKPKSRSIKGTVVSVGGDFTTGFGVVRKTSDYAKVGEEIVFFTNDPEFDFVEIDQQKYYLVSFEDLRLRKNG